MDGYLTIVFLATSVLAPIVAAPLIARQFILRPVFLAACRPAPRTNYMVSDIACLALYLSLASMLVKLARFELINQSQEVGMMATAGLFVLCSWWLGVRSLSRARITDTLKRCVYLSVAVPLSYVGVVVFPPATVLMIMLALRIVDRSSIAGAFASSFVMVVTYLFLVVGLFLSRHIAHWVTTATSPRVSASKQE